MSNIHAVLRKAIARQERAEWRSTSGLFENGSSEEIGRQVCLNDLRFTTSHYSPELCDPIFTPIFTAILGSGGFTLFGTTITWASVASAIATTALLAGVQYALMKPPKPDRARQPLTQAIPYRFWGVGETRIAGAMMFYEVSGPYLASVQAIAAHPIEGYTRYYLHDDQVTLTGNNVNPGIKNRYGSNIVKLYPRTGSVPGVPIDEIVDLFEADGIWTEDHRGDGQAYIGMVCTAVKVSKFTAFYPYGKPVLSVVAKLAKVWDFRDPDQDPDDDMTWVFSKNPVLQLAWHECLNPFGPRRDFRKAILPVLDMWQEEADVCDEPIARAVGGTEPRYECNGYDTTENDPKVGTNAILASMDGWMCERGDGALLVVAGKFREKYVATLTDADVVGHAIQHDVLPEEEVNRLVPKFIYPATDYTEADTDFFEDTEAQVEVGRVLSRDAAFDWVTEWRQARRLGKREYQRLRAKKRGRLDTRLTGINAAHAPWIRLATPRRMPQLNGALFSNRKSVLNLLKGGFSMDLVAMPDDIDAWNPATDEGAAPPVPAAPTEAVDAVPTIDSIIAVPSGGSIYLQVFIVDPNDESLTPVVQWRVKDTGAGDPGSWVTQEYSDTEPEGGLILLSTGAVPADAILEVEAAFRDGKNKLGAFTSPPEEVDTKADTVAPGALTSFIATGAAPRLGHVPFSFGTPNSANVQTIELYRAPTGGALDTAAHLVAQIAVGPSATYTYKDGDETRTNLLLNGEFDTDTDWSKGTGWTIAAGKAQFNDASSATLTQAPALTGGSAYRTGYSVLDWVASTVRFQIVGTTTVTGFSYLANGTYLQTLTAPAAPIAVQFRGNGGAQFSIDDVVMYEQTATCIPAGTWDYYAIPYNGSGVAGPTAGPVTVTVI